MMRAARFVIDETITPAIERYNNSKSLVPFVITEEKFLEIKHVKDITTNAKTIVSQFKKTGDLYKYLKNITSGSSSVVENLIRSLGLKPFEDIIEEFESEFSEDLEDCTQLEDLIIGDFYTTWDLVFLSGIYRTQIPGILKVCDDNNNPISVIARGSFSEHEHEHEYNNQYLVEDGSRVKYYLIKGNHKYNNLITELHLYTYLFETIGPNRQIFKGVYVLESFNRNENYVILKRKNVNNASPQITSNIEHHFGYRNRYKISERTSGGKSSAGRQKEISGNRAENAVSEFLHLKNITHTIISESKTSHKFDIRVDGLTNLEVKNVSNIKGFYLSDSQMKELENSNTRLCLVEIIGEESFIYISKPYSEIMVLDKIFSDIKDLKDNTISKYNGRFRIDSIEIGLIKPEAGIIEDFGKDFKFMNNLSQSQIISFLQD